MLALPRTKPVASLDTSSAVQFLAQQQGCPEELVRSDFETLTRLRDRALGITEPSEAGQLALLNYSHHLSLFLPRLQGFQAQLKLNFSWNDAFGLQLKTTSHSFYFEWGCILWNLAAFESTLGARIDRLSDDGIRAASRHFQQAAGYIDVLAESVLPQLQINSFPCLSHDGVAMAKQLLLAQAQLCFYEKAVKDKKAGKMKAGIIAKLAKQAQLYYSAASSASRAGTLGAMLDSSWSAIAEFQSLCFSAAAEYWQAHASKEAATQSGTGYGEEVARFNRAEQRINLCLAHGQRYSQSITPALIAGAQGLKAAALEHRQNAERDLRTIYLESAPPDSSLVEVAPVAMVRPAAMPTPAEVEVVALFKYVLPQEIRVYVQKFAEEAAAAHQTTSAAAENATSTGRSALSAVGLPGSLEAAKTESPLPQSLWTKVQQAQASGGFQRLRSMHGDLLQASRRTQEALQNINSTSEREEKTDEEFFRRFPEWTGSRSVQLNADVRTNTLRMKETLHLAQTSDANLGNEISKEQATEADAVLSKSKEQLLQMFPTQASVAAASHSLLDFDEELDGAGSGKDQGLSPEGKALEQKLHELADLLYSRSQQLEELRSVCQQDITEKFSAAMSQQHQADVRSVYEEEFSKAKAVQHRLDDGVQRQQALLAEIMKLNEAFVKSRDASPLAVQRAAVISKIEQSWAKFNLLFSQISAGLTFYSSLQAKLTGLLQNACDIAYTQQWQRQDYEAQRTLQMERSAQEMRDREMAMKLADELANGGATPPAPAGAPASSGAVVYGTPAGSQFSYPGIDLMGGGGGSRPVSGHPPAFAPLSQAAASPYPTLNVSHSPAGGQAPVPMPVPAAPAAAVPPGGSAGVYQYNNSSYNMAAAPAPAPPAQPQYNIPQQHSSAMDFNTKVARLVEMGFPAEQVSAMLTANDGDENAALNALLSSAAAAPAPVQAKPEKKNSMFKVWGK